MVIGTMPVVEFAAGKPTSCTAVGDAGKFTDVKAGSYYEKAVVWAIEQGITEGTSATTFSPDMICTRGQIVTFMWRNAGSPITTYLMQMKDVQSDKYYTEAVRWALSEKITEGTSETTFSPNANCNRAQVVTFLYRQMGKNSNVPLIITDGCNSEAISLLR